MCDALVKKVDYLMAHNNQQLLLRETVLSRLRTWSGRILNESDREAQTDS